jgi:hypothetical protein
MPDMAMSNLSAARSASTEPSYLHVCQYHVQAGNAHQLRQQRGCDRRSAGRQKSMPKSPTPRRNLHGASRSASRGDESRKHLQLDLCGAILLRRDDQTLPNLINIWIDQIDMDGTLGKIRAKWLGDSK